MKKIIGLKYIKEELSEKGYHVEFSNRNRTLLIEKCDFSFLVDKIEERFDLSIFHQDELVSMYLGITGFEVLKKVEIY